MPESLVAGAVRRRAVSSAAVVPTPLVQARNPFPQADTLASPHDFLGHVGLVRISSSLGERRLVLGVLGG